MRPSSLFAYLAFGATLHAQSVSSAVVLLQTNSAGCPVALDARHAQNGGLISVSPSTPHAGQGYRITFTPEKTRGVAQAKITLHGISGHHVIPAGETAEPASNETFTVSPAPTDHGLFRSTVYPEKLTGVQWVELNDLTYADGTRWQESPTATCRVALNGYMLVAGSAH